MNEGYLWDKTGEPDPDIARLEALLGPLRETDKLQEPRRRRTLWIPLAMAASIVIASLIAWQVRGARQIHWEVKQISGQVDRSQLHAGEWLDTDGSSRAQLILPSTGKLELEPNSRMGLLISGNDKQSLSLSHGTLKATIWAPAGEFSVAAPSATAVDLGCIYTVQTDDRGDGLVRVEAGWVALEDHGRESFIPGGSVCRMIHGRGPGIPYLETSAEPLKQMIQDFDVSGVIERLQPGLARATRADDVTLWHLLRRVPPAQRGLVYDRLQSLVSFPVSLTHADAVRGDPRVLDDIWTALGYGDADWWRKWKAGTISR